MTQEVFITAIQHFAIVFVICGIVAALGDSQDSI